ncbi:MAG: twin-arginine translocase TatA/TatE family subunit [Adlercreutzia equolifaciens]|nr:twin-arginine translocase TatA/TatE family subunit [Adlercreutzia equolifaciens]
MTSKILGLGVPELVIILVVVLLIFGPKNLPKLGASLGKTVKSLREGMAFDKKDDEEVEEIIERPAPLLFVLPDAVHFVGCPRR